MVGDQSDKDQLVGNHKRERVDRNTVLVEEQHIDPKVDQPEQEDTREDNGEMEEAGQVDNHIHKDHEDDKEQVAYHKDHVFSLQPVHSIGEVEQWEGIWWLVEEVDNCHG